jgi:Thioredoxin-like
MIPHERSLVEKYADQPFAIVGVDSDKDRAQVAAACEKLGIGWRSFWNGPEGSRGPIASAWDVEGWPTIYILDAKGVIRYKSVGANLQAIEETIEKLLAESP